MASDVKLMGIIRQELLAIRDEYGDARRTEILTETSELTIEDLLADEEMVSRSRAPATSSALTWRRIGASAVAARA